MTVFFDGDPYVFDPDTGEYVDPHNGINHES